MDLRLAPSALRVARVGGRWRDGTVGKALTSSVLGMPYAHLRLWLIARCVT